MAGLPEDLLAHARAARGFMPEEEGALLHRWARERLPQGPVLEVGTYCGKSAIWLGGAAREVGGTVFTVDHHRGSEENQAGWEQHDATPVDPDVVLSDTVLPFHSIRGAHVVRAVDRCLGWHWNTWRHGLPVDADVEPADISSERQSA